MKKMEACDTLKANAVSKDLFLYIQTCTDFLCCYRDYACSSNYASLEYIFNLREMFFDTACGKCKDVATAYNLRDTTDQCKEQTSYCITDTDGGILEGCNPPVNMPISVMLILRKCTIWCFQAR